MKKAERVETIRKKVEFFMARHPRLKLSFKRADESHPNAESLGLKLTFSFKNAVGNLVHAEDVTQVHAVAMSLAGLFPRYTLFLESVSEGVFVYKMEKLRHFPIF